MRAKLRYDLPYSCFWFVILTFDSILWRNWSFKLLLLLFIRASYGYWFLEGFSFLSWINCGVGIGWKAQFNYCFLYLRMMTQCQLPNAWYEGSDLALQWLKSWLQFFIYLLIISLSIQGVHCLAFLWGFEFHPRNS